MRSPRTWSWDCSSREATSRGGSKLTSALSSLQAFFDPSRREPGIQLDSAGPVQTAPDLPQSAFLMLVNPCQTSSVYLASLMLSRRSAPAATEPRAAAERSVL